MIPAVRELAVAGSCGALGVIACAVFRIRLLAVAVALGIAVVAAAAMPGSPSPLVTYVGRVTRPLAQTLPGVPVGDVLGVGLVFFGATALVCVHRRRVI